MIKRVFSNDDEDRAQHAVQFVHCPIRVCSETSRILVAHIPEIFWGKKRTLTLSRLSKRECRSGLLGILFFFLMSHQTLEGDPQIRWRPLRIIEILAVDSLLVTHQQRLRLYYTLVVIFFFFRWYRCLSMTLLLPRFHVIALKYPEGFFQGAVDCRHRRVTNKAFRVKLRGRKSDQSR